MALFAKNKTCHDERSRTINYSLHNLVYARGVRLSWFDSAHNDTDLEVTQYKYCVTSIFPGPRVLTRNDALFKIRGC